MQAGEGTGETSPSRGSGARQGGRARAGACAARRPGRGVIDDSVIRDAFAAKALSPENIGTHSRTNYPLVWVEGAVDVGRLTVEGFSRDEKTVPVATLRVDSATTVRTLTVRDCKMSNALDAPVPFLEAKGTVGKVTVENVDFAGRWTQTGDR